MKFGAEKKKIWFLVVLTVAAAYLLYSNLFSSPSAPTEARAARTPVADQVRQAAAAVNAGTPAGGATRPANARRTLSDFHPAYTSKEKPDLSTIDPKLRLDLLARVQSVEPAAAERNLFAFGAAAVPGVPGGEPHKVTPKTPDEIKRELEASKASGPPGPPPPPPITLRYYGYTAQRIDGHKRAFFLDGEDILVAGEGELVKRRYKVVRIGINSVTLEDTQYNNTQMVPLMEEGAG